MTERMTVRRGAFLDLLERYAAVAVDHGKPMNRDNPRHKCQTCNELRDQVIEAAGFQVNEATPA